ncbi:MAG: ABC transporter permease [Ignavibacteriaceae bacterium]
MKIKVRIWHSVILFCVLIFFIRIGFIFDIYSLLFSFISLSFSSFTTALNQLNADLADYFASALLIVVIPVLAVVFRAGRFFNARLSFNSFVLIILACFFIFAPLITDVNPDFQKDLRITKLLPPLSSLKVIQLDSRPVIKKDFYEVKNRVVKSSFNESVIFADSVKWGKTIVYYQKGRQLQIDETILKTNKIVIKTKTFYLGTDEYGRDVFARLVYGARISLFVGLGAVCITLLLGVILGFTAGYLGGIADTVLSRFTDMLLAFPIIFLIILILALFGNSLLTVIMVLGYSGWMSLFKIVRGEVISIKQKEYFISAKLAGLSGKNILIKEILPVVVAPVVVNLVFQYGIVVLAESALSFLGLGTGSIYPSWGSMIESGQEYLTEAWWLIFFPSAALFVTLFTANNLGKELNLFFNPRLVHDK